MGSQPPNDLCAAALDLAARGFRILPVHGAVNGACKCPDGAACGSAGKHPLLIDWPGRATTDADVVRAWWGRWPAASVAVACGRASGVWILDVDRQHAGDETLAALERQHGRLPDSPVVLSGGGGEHRYFVYPDGIEIRPSVGGLGPGLDVRGEGSYVLAPPSFHVSGRRYEWEASAHVADLPLAQAPRWLLDQVLLNKRIVPSSVAGLIAAGERNATLASFAGSMRRRGMSEAAILAALTVENQARCAPPLDTTEVSRIARSVARYAPNRPDPIRVDVAP